MKQAGHDYTVLAAAQAVASSDVPARTSSASLVLLPDEK